MQRARYARQGLQDVRRLCIDLDRYGFLRNEGDELHCKTMAWPMEMMMKMTMRVKLMPYSDCTCTDGRRQPLL